MDNLTNIKPVDRTILDNALHSFENDNGYDFFDLLTNSSTQKEYYNKNKNRDWNEYIQESKEIYDEINLIMDDITIHY